MQVFVSNLFESIVYHIYIRDSDSKEVLFLIWDPIHQKFDLVDADLCKPLNIAAQDLKTTRKIAAQAQRERENKAYKEYKDRVELDNDRRERIKERQKDKKSGE